MKGRTTRKNRLCMMLLGLVMTLVLLTGSCVYAQEVPASQDQALTVTARASLEGDNLGAAASLIESGRVKFAIGSGEEEVLVNAGVSIGDVDFLSLLASLTPEKIAVQIPQAGENVYEMSMAKATEYVMQLISQIRDDSGNAVDPSALVPQISSELISEAVAPVMEVAGEHIVACTTITEEGFALEKLGTSVESGTVYTYKPSAQEIEAVLNKLADAVENNEALDQFIAQLAEYIRGLQGVTTFTGSVSGSQTEFDARQMADQIEQVYAELPAQMRENAAEIGQMLEAMDATVTVGVTPEGMPGLIELRLTQGEQVLRAAFELAQDGTNTQYYLGIAIDQEEYALSGEHSVEGTQVSGAVHMTAAPMGEILSVGYQMDFSKKSLLGAYYGEYSFEMAGGPSVFVSVEAGAAEGTDTITIHVEGLEVLSGGSSEGMPGAVTVWIDASTQNTAVAPEGTAVDVTDYTPEQFGELFDQISENITGYLNQ